MALTCARLLFCDYVRFFPAANITYWIRNVHENPENQKGKMMRFLGNTCVLEFQVSFFFQSVLSPVFLGDGVEV